MIVFQSSALPKSQSIWPAILPLLGALTSGASAVSCAVLMWAGERASYISNYTSAPLRLCGKIRVHSRNSRKSLRFGPGHSGLFKTPPHPRVWKGYLRLFTVINAYYRFFPGKKDCLFLDAPKLGGEGKIDTYGYLRLFTVPSPQAALPCSWHLFQGFWHKFNNDTIRQSRHNGFS
jgi:hypothetical protein